MMYGYGFRPNNKMFGGAINPLWDGLLAYYTSDNTPNDALGNYNGTLVNGATYATGKINNGFSLDGVNDYVSLVNNSFDLTSDFSISIWFKTSISGAYQVLFSNYTNLDTNGLKIDIRNTNVVRFVIYNGTLHSLLGSTTINIGSWNNIIITRKSSTRSRMYINGVLDVSNSDINNPSFTTPNYPTLGVSRFQTSLFEQFFNGNIDETAIWNKELTSDEVTEVYNSGACLQYPN